MKSKVKVLLVFLMVTITSVIFTGKTTAQQPYVSFQVFYDELDPYGEWVDYPNLGYVWIPYAGPDFVPYSTYGHWIYTNYGWTWMSDYRWGWAPFHYGRWDFDNFYGWFWVPDNEWGPAWVSWRMADGYYGWAPMEPGISLSVSFGMGYNSHNDHWIFVRDRDIDRSDIHQYYINRNDQDRIIRRSSVINNTYVDRSRNTTYVSGPARTDFQRATGRQVSPVTVSEYNKPGQDMRNGQLSIYRPEIMKNNDRERRSAPSRITNLKDVKQPSERRAIDQSGNADSRGTMNRDRQPATINQQRNINTINREQPQNTNPLPNVRRDQQQNNVKQENISPPQNIKREQQQNNVKQENINPPQNIRREQQQNNVKQENINPPQNIRREQQQNNVKQENINPPQNIRREQQQNNVKQENINPPQNIRREQQQNNVKQQNINPPQNVKKEQKTNTSRSTVNGKKEQQKNSGNENEKRKKN